MRVMSIYPIRLMFILVALMINQGCAVTDKYEQRFNQILDEYRAIPHSTDVKRLVDLHYELDALVKEVQPPEAEWGASRKYWRKELLEVGLYIGHYTDELGYSGKLLVEAHKINPHSPYRSHTLFTTILGSTTSHGLGVMPDLNQAELYLDEFGDGPYVGEVYAIFGYFYDDLAKSLIILIEEGERGLDYKSDCFWPYITKEPYPEQLRRAEALTIDYLSKAIAISRPEKADKYKLIISDVRKGESFRGWHWCAD